MKDYKKHLDEMYHVSRGFNVFPDEIGFWVDDVPTSIINDLKKQIEKINLNRENAVKWNYQLAGNLEEEYRLEKNKNFEDYILKLVDDYGNVSGWPGALMRGLNCAREDLNIELTDPWINFQKKYEFNPIHTHSGALSYVIWFEIPYLQEEELESGPGREGNHSSAGTFNFVISDVLGKIKSVLIPVDRRYNGRICLFPAALDHGVHPFFSSDEERITIAGNINFYKK